MLRALFLSLSLTIPTVGLTAPCGNTSAGFEAWKADFAKQARRAGVKRKGLQALAQTQYATRTIAADRNQKSFKYSLDKFMRVRGADTIVAQGRKRKSRNPDFYAALERQYGVPSASFWPSMAWKPALGTSWATVRLFPQSQH